MKEVLKNEVLKLLEAYMIYRISYRSWISPVHMVLKKGGMTVIKNVKWEFILTLELLGGECALAISG